MTKSTKTKSAESTAVPRRRAPEDPKTGLRPADPTSPSGRKLAVIEVADFDVSIKGSEGHEPMRITGVTGPTQAIREYVLLSGIEHSHRYRFLAVEVPDTRRDAGDEGYHADSVRRKQKTAAAS